MEMAGLNVKKALKGYFDTVMDNQKKRRTAALPKDTVRHFEWRQLADISTKSGRSPFSFASLLFSSFAGMGHAIVTRPKSLL
jgi:hypothetical protein